MANTGAGSTGGTTTTTATTATIPEPTSTTASRATTRAPSGAGDYTAHTWAEALLQMLGAPVTPQNIKAIVAWEAAEGGHWANTAWYNPINTTLNEPGSHSMNGVGVKAYTSWQQGLQATAATLRQGNMKVILDALMRGNDAGAVADAIVHSPWGTKSISLDGNYVSYGTTARHPTMEGTYTANNPGDSLNPTNSAQLTKADFLQGLDAAGFPKALLESIPELKNIFDRAVQGKWWQTEAGQTRFLTAVKSTTWYQQTTATQRTMEALKVENPKEYELELTNKLADVRDMASGFGLQLAPGELNAVAERALTMGLDENKVRNLLAAHVKFQENAKYTGQLGVDVPALQSLASNYFVSVGDNTMTNLLQQMVRGQMNPSDMTDYFKQLAESKFPWLKKQLDAGQTVADVADPYKQEMAKILEVDPNGIKNEDPMVMKGLQQRDQASGEFGLMPIWQFDQQLRSDPRWLYTENARNSLMDVTGSLLKQWGLMA